MHCRFATADVFTDRMFQGNPVAVILNAEGLASEQMQAIALEFNYVETTFVLPPRDPSHTVRVRIFTPSRGLYRVSSSTPRHTKAAAAQRRRSTFSCRRNFAAAAFVTNVSEAEAGATRLTSACESA